MLTCLSKPVKIIPISTSSCCYFSVVHQTYDKALPSPPKNTTFINTKYSLSSLRQSPSPSKTLPPLRLPLHTPQALTVTRAILHLLKPVSAASLPLASPRLVT